MGITNYLLTGMILQVGCGRIPLRKSTLFDIKSRAQMLKLLRNLFDIRSVHMQKMSLLLDRLNLLLVIPIVTDICVHNMHDEKGAFLARLFAFLAKLANASKRLGFWFRRHAKLHALVGFSVSFITALPARFCRRSASWFQQHGI